jgi:hypothetical protein
MKFYQKDDGGCDLVFSDEEIKIINKHKRLRFTPFTFRHFGNVIVEMVARFQLFFDDKLANLETFSTQKIEGESPKEDKKNDTDTK